MHMTNLTVFSLSCDKMHPIICSTKMQFHSMWERGSKMYDSHRKFQGYIIQYDKAIALCPWSVMEIVLIQHLVKYVWIIFILRESWIAYWLKGNKCHLWDMSLSILALLIVVFQGYKKYNTFTAKEYLITSALHKLQFNFTVLKCFLASKLVWFFFSLLNVIQYFQIKSATHVHT